MRLSSLTTVWSATLVLGTCFLGLARAQNDQPLITAAIRFENVHVLADMPAEQMGKVMNIMSAALGVSCQHCHSGTDFAKEGLARKDTARDMLVMTAKLNAESFVGKIQVTCNTCHRGHTRPRETNETMLVANELSAAFRESAAPSELSVATGSLSVVAVVDAYFNALGTADRLREIAHARITAERIEPDGRREPETLWFLTTGGKTRLVTEYPTAEVVEIYDGSQAWKGFNGQGFPLKPDEALQLSRQALVAMPWLHREFWSSLELAGEIERDQRTLIVLRAKGNVFSDELFLFDEQSGLLTQRLASVSTVLGPFQSRTDYLDYREFEGLSIPTRIQFSMPGVSWVREIQSVEFNRDTDEGMFSIPKPTSDE